MDYKKICDTLNNIYEGYNFLYSGNDNGIYGEWIQWRDKGIKSVRITTKNSDTLIKQIIKKINTGNVYKNMQNVFEKIKVPVYYFTSYGFAIDNAFISKEKQDKNIAIIENILKEHNILYTTEVSQAGYIYRYKISKSKENIEKIKSLL